MYSYTNCYFEPLYIAEIGRTIKSGESFELDHEITHPYLKPTAQMSIAQVEIPNE